MKKKLSAILFLMALLAQPVHAAERATLVNGSGVEVGTTSNRLVTAGSTAQANGLRMDVVEANAHKTMATNFYLDEPCTTANGYQFCGYWDDGRYFTASMRSTDGLVWTATHYDGLPQQPTFTGSGLNDMQSGGTANTGITATSTFDVVIDGTGAPDTFKWRLNGGAYTTGVAITGSNQTLSNGVTILFTATTGHTLNDSWSFTVQPPIQLSGDGDLHQGISVAVDSTGILHYSIGSYITGGGLHYRRSTSANSTSGITAEQTIHSGAIYDTDASYVQFFKDPVAGTLYVDYRCNGASGNNDWCMYQYDTSGQTWSAATGTQQSVVVGRFANGVGQAVPLQGMYVGLPFIKGQKAYFTMTWRDDTGNSVIYEQRDCMQSFFIYDMANGTFTKASGATQTIPITGSNGDNVDTEVNTSHAGEIGLVSTPYRTQAVVDGDGTINVIYSRFTGNIAKVTQTTGSGVNDLISEGIATGFNDVPTFYVRISTAASPQDSFKYRINGGAESAAIKITGSFQTLSNGISIQFATVTGHTLNDVWTIQPRVTNENVFRRYWTGSAWSSLQQLTNMGERQTRIFPTENVAQYNGVNYIIYHTFTEGMGINVMSTTDWVNFKKFTILPGGTGQFGGATLGPENFDREAFRTTGVLYMMVQINPDYVGTNANQVSPLYMVRWDAESGASIPTPHMKSFVMGTEDFNHGSYWGIDATWGTSRQVGANLWQLVYDRGDGIRPDDDIQNFAVNIAAAGDTLYLPTNKTYALTSPIVLSHAITIVCPGGPDSTIIGNANSGQDAIQITTSNVHIINCGISLTGTGTQRGVYANSAVSAPLTGIILDGIKVSGTKASGVGYAFHIENSSADIYRPESTLTVSATNNVEGIFVQNDSSVGSNTTVNIYNPKIVTAGAGTTTNGISSQDNTASKTSTVNVYNGSVTITESAAATTCGISSFGGSDAVINVYGTTVSGTDNDLCEANSAVLNNYEAVLVNGTTTGTITGSGVKTIGELKDLGVSADGNGKATCVKSDGNLGTCSDAVGAGGTCTCG